MDDLVFPGFDGFLGTRASFMLDLLCVAMLGILLVLTWSVYQVRYRRRYNLHKWTQVTLGIILLFVVILFEIDIRLHGWESRAAGKLGGDADAVVWYALYIHLVFAISTVVLWPITIVLALRNFQRPPIPGPHSRVHLLLARIAALAMVVTTLTGWIFYWTAFLR